MKHFNCTDLGNGERFKEFYGYTVRYLIEDKAWIQHTEDGWHYVADGHILTMPVVRSIYKEASDKALDDSDHGRGQQDSESRQRLANWAVYSESTTAQNHMLREAQAMMGIHIAEFDADPFLINCRNGVVDLTTKALIPHKPDKDTL